MRRYFAEFNRVTSDNIRIAAKKLARQGLSVTVLAHKTSLLIEKPDSMSWSELKDALRSVLQPRRGSVMLSSETTGKTFICRYGGNRPGDFILQ